ncbi:MAG: flagellar hook-length control protein FliK [Treponema sp.]|jgi:hypothetical protein|nr:flagellar hook-length control protein FliK [Treponema sp.]
MLVEPSHLQNEPPPVSAEQIRFEESPGVFRKKSRKNDGPGVFAKLLAGLIAKKAGPPAAAGETGGAVQSGDIQRKQARKESLRPGNRGTAGAEDLLFRFPGGEASGEAALPEKQEVARDETIPPGTEGFPAWNGPRLSLTKTGTDVTEADAAEVNAAETGVPDAGAEAAPAEPAGSFAALRGGSPEKIRDTPEINVPFLRREDPDPSVQGEIQSEIHSAAFRAEDRGIPAENPGEARKNGRRDRSVLEVRDFRTRPETGAGSWEVRPGPAEDIRDRPGLTPDLRHSFGEPGLSPDSPEGPESFEQLLARELRGDLSGDIVKQAAVVLRDGEGTIRLSLKPESLGKVKIHLEMAENKISGHIFVETEEALRAFEQEIHTLEQSFRDSGFEASLSAALDYRDGGRRWKEETAGPFFSERFAASAYEGGADPGITEASGGYDPGLPAVNMLV